MEQLTITRIFLSYARGDDESFVWRLYEGLKAVGFAVWFDRVSMPSRELSFSREIEDAIMVHDRLVLVVGPSAVASDYVTQEWRFAFHQAMKCVHPIVRRNGTDAAGKFIDGYDLIPEDLRGPQVEDFRDDSAFDFHLANLARQLSEPLPPPGNLSAPELPEQLPESVKFMDIIKRALIVDEGAEVESKPIEVEPITAEMRHGWETVTRTVSSIHAMTCHVVRQFRYEVPASTLEQVQFSVTAPPKVRPRAAFLVDVWAHMEEQYDRIIDIARQSVPGESIQVRSVDPVPVARGTVLSVRLAMRGMKIEPQQNTILWEGRIGRAAFLVTAPFSIWGRSAAGTAQIYASGLEIARIYFVVKIGRRAAEPDRIPHRMEQHRKAFASYSSVDREQVLARIQGIQKAVPSLEVFFDVLNLRSGQDWQSQLWSVIPTHDVFYLFWSANARNSDWVEKEWRCALKTRGLDFIDPVPLCGPDQAPPPKELAGKHFNDWVLAFMRNPLSDQI